MNEKRPTTTASPIAGTPTVTNSTLASATGTASGLAPVLDSLTIAAERVPDFYQRAMARYFELCPDSRSLMSHTDEYIQGRMMEQVVSLFMENDLEALDSYFAFEATNHHSYGAEPQMYRHLFEACLDVVVTANAQDWNDTAAAAWQTQIDRLLGCMLKHLPSSPR